jgi:DNA-binding transcriptional ArsR family regulator
MINTNEIKQLTKEFKECQKSLSAIGDATRQHIIISLLECDCKGVRVGEITKKTNLSRPAVSHHLQILKDAGIIGMRREGTKNYYYLDSKKTELNKLMKILQHVQDILEKAPHRE